MFAKANPGTCGVAAILPTKPGTQKLTPPSSAREFVVAVTTRLPASGAATTNFRQANECQNTEILLLIGRAMAHQALTRPDRRCGGPAVRPRIELRKTRQQAAISNKSA